jgi:hypothetical protein
VIAPHHPPHLQQGQQHVCLGKQSACLITSLLIVAGMLGDPAAAGMAQLPCCVLLSHVGDRAATDSLTCDEPPTDTQATSPNSPAAPLALLSALGGVPPCC